MPDTLTNLTGAVGTPMIVLAPATEFIMVDDVPVAHKTRMGTNWLGLNGTFGTLTKSSLSYLGDKGEIGKHSPGMLRSLHWTKLGYKLELEVHWDRQQIGLRKGDRFTAWIDTGEGNSTPSKVNFHVEDISGDMGDEDTATRKIVAEHRAGLDNITDLIVARTDGMGAVIQFTETAKFNAAATDPALNVPTDTV